MPSLAVIKIKCLNPRSSRTLSYISATDYVHLSVNTVKVLKKNVFVVIVIFGHEMFYEIFLLKVSYYILLFYRVLNFEVCVNCLHHRY